MDKRAMSFVNFKINSLSAHRLDDASACSAAWRAIPLPAKADERPHRRRAKASKRALHLVRDALAARSAPSVARSAASQ